MLASAAYSVTALLPRFVTKVFPLAFNAKLIGVLNCVFEPEMLIAGAKLPLPPARYAVTVLA